MVSTATAWETLPDITSAALTDLDQGVLDFLEGGAGEEWTLRRNRQAFSEWAFSPRLLSGHQRPDLSTSFLGVPLRTPVLTGPFGADTLFHPDGQKAVARANAQAGVSGMAPEAGSYSYLDVRREAPAGMAFGQLHPTGPEDAFLRRLGELEHAGFQGLVVTCDCPTGGWRERNRHNRYTPPHTAVAGNVPTGTGTGDVFADLFGGIGPMWSWDQLGRVMSHTALPWMAKGITTVHDAEAAITAGASAVGVSNHGGRQLDGVPAALDVLPDVASAVGGRVQVAFDSGIRRGSDVVKALALGADVVILGRLAIYGLIVDGERGVRRVLELLHQEVTNVMTLLGASDVRSLDRRSLRNPHTARSTVAGGPALAEQA